jgi:hypothetical protein
MYADAGGESHFEDVEIEFGDTVVAENIEPWGLSEPVPVTAAIFLRRSEAAAAIGWHNAPRRQFVIRLQGDVSIEVSDGEVRHLGPGSVLLAEDTTGKGHRGVSASGEGVALVLPFTDQEQRGS